MVNKKVFQVELFLKNMRKNTCKFSNCQKKQCFSNNLGNESMRRISQKEVGHLRPTP
jgi:hypothetical protein